MTFGERRCAYDIIINLLQVGNSSIVVNDEDEDISITEHDMKMQF